jgi:outer membrane receptor protein involved in Fe transport
VTDWLRITGNYALFAFSVSGANENDVLLPNAPRYKLNGGVTVTRDGFTGGLSVKYVPGFDWAAGIFKGPVPAYTLVNLDASYQLTSQIEMGVNVTNLLDRGHYQLFGGSLLQRRLVAGLTVRF